MNVDEVVQYWLELAKDDWPVAEHLLASGDYHYLRTIREVGQWLKSELKPQ